jgi:IS30 family transposase
MKAARNYPQPASHAEFEVSHETIYTALYAMPRGTLRTELIACRATARIDSPAIRRGQYYSKP